MTSVPENGSRHQVAHLDAVLDAGVGCMARRPEALQDVKIDGRRNV